MRNESENVHNFNGHNAKSFINVRKEYPKNINPRTDESYCKACLPYTFTRTWLLDRLRDLKKVLVMIDS